MFFSLDIYAASIIILLDFQDYSEMSVAYRPSHADATYDMKYGVRSVQVISFSS